MSQYDNIHEDFPLLIDIDGEEQFAHFVQLREHLKVNKPITNSELYGSFDDDHLPNYNVSITVEGEVYKFCMGYIADASILFHLARAPYDPDAYQTFVTYMLDYLNDL